MEYETRYLNAQDEPVLWTMLRYAAHEASEETVKQQPPLARYVVAWGRSGDWGYGAWQQDKPLGAAWVRRSSPGDRGYGYLSDEIPELAIAIIPNYRGQGIGTRLLTHLLAAAEHRVPGISLSVRSDNPAMALYTRLGFVPVPHSEVTNRAGGRSLTMIYQIAALP